MSDSLPPMIARHELKYVVPHALIEPISEFVAPYCVLDDHTAGHADRFYPVNSLYFDTINYRFLKQRMWGADRRFNMRMRSYGDGREGPYFAEVKYKTPTTVRKYRATVNLEEWPAFLIGEPVVGRSCAAARDKAEAASLELFLRLANSYAIEPKIFTCYRRRAFVSVVDDYARVTMDIEMRYRQQDPVYARDPYSLVSGPDCINYDSQTIYDDEAGYGADVILELKATIGAVPLWMIEMIRRFQLKQVGFSKYLNSTMVEHFDHGWRYMSGDRSAVN